MMPWRAWLASPLFVAGWPDAMLGPANHNVLTHFLLTYDASLSLLESCFDGNIARREECCAAPAEACFLGSSTNDMKPTHYQCCWALRNPGQRLPPKIYMFPSLDGYEKQMGVAMSPRNSQAVCVARASGVFLRMYGDFAVCTASGQRDHRACFEATISSAEEELSSMHSASDKECGGLPTGFGTGWADFWTSLRLVLQVPSHRIGSQVVEALETLNTYIWQLHHLQASGADVQARFRPAAAALASPLPVQGDLHSSAVRPHRGDVLMRLLQAAEASRQEPRGSGLVFVELGTGEGDLARWLAVRAFGILSTMHVVDTFVHEEGWGYDEERFQLVAKSLEDLGFRRSEEDQIVVLRMPSDAHQSRLGSLEIRIHRMTSLLAAASMAPASVDAVFVDAAHSYEEVSADIGAWWPKLLPGGCMAGHDFRRLDRAFWKVGGVREAVAGSFQRDVFLDSDTVWWTLK